MGASHVRHGEAWAVNLRQIEIARCERQNAIDASKTIDDRRRMGQFATPNELAVSILKETCRYLPAGGKKLNILEPAMGTGSFVSAAISVLEGRVNSITGYELDTDFHAASSELWAETCVNSIHGDFTRATPVPEHDLVLSNPPYSRHHFLSAAEKRRLQSRVKASANVAISGLAGLYCHFLLLSLAWMRSGAVGVWLIPSEWMSVNYGSAIRTFLTRRVRLLRIHRFDEEDVRFSDALVSSCVVWFRNEQLISGEVEFSYGSDIEKPARKEMISLSLLASAGKWPPRDGAESHAHRLGDLFQIRRGLVTGDNNFFVIKEADASRRNIPGRFLKPILPSPRHLKVDHVESDADGLPTNIERRYLLDCTGYAMTELPESVREYLTTGIESTARKNLCASRNVWYEQEQRKPTPFLCSYMGRGSGDASPVRFILNDTKAIASNSFLMMYPKKPLSDLIALDPDSADAVWSFLVRIPRAAILSAGRSYGGGLRKVEPRELANVPCEELYGWLRSRV